MMNTEIDKRENLKSLIEENHDLTSLESEAEVYLKEAILEGDDLLLKLNNFLENKDDCKVVLEKIAIEKLVFEENIKQTFFKLKEDLSQKNTNEQEEKENPLISIMVAFKTSLFSAKKETEDQIKKIVSIIGFEGDKLEELKKTTKCYFLNGGKKEAISGIKELKKTNELHRVLLKVAFSLLVAEMKTPFINKAPADVLTHFDMYLKLIKEGLKVPFVEFYKNTEDYLN